MSHAPPMPEPAVLLDGLAYVESPRWHQGRLWFAHWGTGEIVAVDLDGNSEVTGSGPPMVNAAAPGHSLGWSIDWLPDGRLLLSGKELLRREPDGRDTGPKLPLPAAPEIKCVDRYVDVPAAALLACSFNTLRRILPEDVRGIASTISSV